MRVEEKTGQFDLQSTGVIFIVENRMNCLSHGAALGTVPLHFSKKG